MTLRRKIIFLGIGPLAFLLLSKLNFLPQAQMQVLGILVWMLSWWMSNLIPLGVTALLPLILFPLLNLMEAKTVGALYGHPIIFLFLGGFALGLAIEKWNLHRRIALNILRLSGSSPARILLGTILATALLSMWISNTATTVMMLPIGLSLYQLLAQKLPESKSTKNLAISLLLGIAYAANIGGMSTLIGTPPNLVLASFSSSSLAVDLAFADWISFALPLCITLIIILWLLLAKVFYPVKLKLEGIEAVLKEELSALGNMSSAERRTAIILGLMAFAWIFRSQINRIEALNSLSDTIIALSGMVLLFIIPANKQSEKSLLLAKDLGKLPWNIILLFGGGLSLAKALETSKLVESIADLIIASGWQNQLLILLIITAFAVFLTEVMSNVALVSVFIPVSFIIARSLGLDELSLAIPLTLGASCAFMFPIATPPNAIVYSSGLLNTKDMARTGLFLNLISILLIALYSYFLVPFFFN